MRILSYLFLAILGIGSAHAAQEAPEPQGIIVLKAIAGYPAGAVTFASIQWTDHNGGYVLDAAGAKTAFVNEGIGRIIYFGRSYYEELDHNQYWIDWRAGLQSREMVLPPIDTVSLSSDDLSRLRDEQKTLEDIVQRYPGGQTILGPMIAQLKDDTDKLSSGLVLQNGKWLSAKDAGASGSVPVVGQASGLVSFTTKNGKTYQNARVVLTDTGISVLTSDGGASVAFENLPDDLSSFPEAVRAKIQASQAEDKERKTEAATAAATTESPGILDEAEAFVLGVIHKVEAYFSSSTSPGTSPSASTNAAPANSDSTNSAPSPKQ